MIHLLFSADAWKEDFSNIVSDFAFKVLFQILAGSFAHFGTNPHVLYNLFTGANKMS
jgi:hypothetical protein